MDNNTPLSKFKRQPKLYIDLPSKGIWYPKGKLNKFEEMEVYSMTANDEIAIKTPDALYTGQAITKVIQSCVPDILDPWLVPMTDIDYILASIRLASYGQDIQLSSTCKECGNEDNYTMEIQRILDFVQTLTLEEVRKMGDDIFEKDKENKIIQNFLSGVTKLGVLGEEFFYINNKMVINKY